jgi:hypothetical protein
MVSHDDEKCVLEVTRLLDGPEEVCSVIICRRDHVEVIVGDVCYEGEAELLPIQPEELDNSSFTYISITLYPRRGSRGISDIPPRRTRFTITKL